MGCPFPEHHSGGSSGGSAVLMMIALGVLGAAVIGWLIHILILAATVIGAVVMIGGAGYGALRYRRWQDRRLDARAQQAAPLPPGDQAGGIHLHIYGDLPPEILSQLTQRRELGGQPGTVPGPRALRAARPRVRRP